MSNMNHPSMAPSTTWPSAESSGTQSAAAQTLREPLTSIYRKLDISTRNALPDSPGT
jgi:hypothetical protein